MKFFFTLNHIINIAMITSVDTYRGIISTVDGKEISLSHPELRDIKSILTELHKQACEKE